MRPGQRVFLPFSASILVNTFFSFSLLVPGASLVLLEVLTGTVTYDLVKE